MLQENHEGNYGFEYKRVETLHLKIVLRRLSDKLGEKLITNIHKKDECL